MSENLLMNISEEEYRSLKGASYSILKALDEIGPEALISDEKVKSEAMDFGSVVDILLLPDNDKAQEKLYIADIVKPTASLLELADACIERKETSDIGICNLIEELGLWSNIKDSKKLVAKFDNATFWDYVNHSIESEGKLLVTSEMYSEAVIAVNTLKSHKSTREIFNHPDYINQAKISAEIRGVNTKGMIDRINIFDNFVSIVDLKTGTPRLENFAYNFFSFKYYLQESLYYSLASEVFKDYDIEPMKFVYISRSNLEVPVIYEMDFKWVDLGLHGWKTISGKTVKGVIELLDDYKWYTDNEIFNVSREVIENNYNLKIDYPIVK